MIMNAIPQKIAVATLLATILLTTGCSSTGSASYGASYYRGYYDPYPCWGCRGNTIIVNPKPPERPQPPVRPPVVRPPIAKPPGGIGRPQQMPRAAPSAGTRRR